MNPIFKGLTEEESERLTAMAKDALNTAEYNPLNCSNFWEAINEADEKRLASAHALLTKGEYVAAAAAMNLIAYDYWLDHCLSIYRDVAKDQLATERYDRELVAH